MIRVVLPPSLRSLANTDTEVTLAVNPPITLGALLDTLEARFPMLCGTIRHHDRGQRRPMIRFFADGQDLSHHPQSTPLPQAVARGEAPLVIVGAIAGG